MSDPTSPSVEAPAAAAAPYAPPPPAGYPPPPAGYPPPPAESLQPFDPRQKSPIVACLLSCMPGLGQIYIGYYVRGFTHALIVCTVIALLSSNVLNSAFLGVFLGFFWLYNLIDAGRRAALYNQAVAGGEEIPLPEGRTGSIVGGAALLVIGLILLSNTAYDMRLDWLEEWWPVGFLAVGGYLVFQGIRERAGSEDRAVAAPAD